MGRVSILGAMAIFLVLSGACSRSQVKLNGPLQLPAADRPLSLAAASDDPLQLGPFLRERLKEQGFSVLPETAAAEEGLLLSYAYRTSLDLNEEGKVGRRLQWLRIRLVDRAGQDEIARGEMRSGMLAQSPEEMAAALITALGERLRRGTASAPQEGEATPAPATRLEELSASAARTEKEPSEAQPQRPAEVPSLTGKAVIQGLEQEMKSSNPWVPRLQSWGLEEWGKER